MYSISEVHRTPSRSTYQEKYVSTRCVCKSGSGGTWEDIRNDGKTYNDMIFHMCLFYIRLFTSQQCSKSQLRTFQNNPEQFLSMFKKCPPNPPANLPKPSQKPSKYVPICVCVFLLKIQYCMEQIRICDKIVGIGTFLRQNCRGLLKDLWDHFWRIVGGVLDDLSCSFGGLLVGWFNSV